MIPPAVSDCLMLPSGTPLLPLGTLSPDGLLAFFSPGYPEMMVVAVVALLLYGGKLPEVARSWGKTFAEFRRGLTGLQNEFKDVVYTEHEQLEYRDDSLNSNGYDDEEYEDEEHFDEGDDTDNDDASHDDADSNDDGAEHLESNQKDDNLNDALQQDPHLAALNQTGNNITNAVTDANPQTVIIDAAKANTSNNDDTPIDPEEKPSSETQKAD